MVRVWLQRTLTFHLGLNTLNGILHIHFKNSISEREEMCNGTTIIERM